MKAKKGISLIVLVITIIVIIILAGAVILSLANNNPVDSANKATFLSERSDAQSSALLAYTNLVSQGNGGTVTPAQVQADIQSTLDKLTTKYKATGTIPAWTTTWAVDSNNEVTVTVVATDINTAPAWLRGMRGQYTWLTVPLT